MLVLLDSEPLGMVTHPEASEEASECSQWLEGLLSQDISVAVPEIVDYEIRRTYIHRDNQTSLRLLDSLVTDIGYLRLNTETFMIAANLWGKARQAGVSTAPEKRLDIDCILAAQAHQASLKPQRVLIATIDIGDLSRYDTEQVKAMRWRYITATS
jgi:predicted nucleic acid-binding protein